MTTKPLHPVFECGLKESIAEKLVAAGFDTLEEIAYRSTQEELLSLDGFGKVSLKALMSVMKKKELKLRKNRNDNELASKLIVKYVRNPDWAKEMRTATSLIKKYGSEIWDKVNLDFKLNTLVFFYSENGKNILKDKMDLEVIKEEVEKPELSACKIGEDRVIKVRPKSLKDFIKYGISTTLT